MEVRSLHPRLGAEVIGISLDHVDDELFKSIYEAFLRHLVLVFRGQDVSPAEQVAFTERIGPAKPHPLGTRRHADGFPQVLVLENRPGRRGARNDFWHSDISFGLEPPKVSILHARKVTEGVGDTLFSNQYAAYEALSPDEKLRFATMTAFHSSEKLAERARNGVGSDARAIANIPAPAEHPVVRAHSDTGRPTVYANAYFTTHFAGLTREESLPVIEDLTARATVKENIYRHKWRAGDVVMWDNRCVMHYAEYDYSDQQPRLMHRTTAY